MNPNRRGSLKVDDVIVAGILRIRPLHVDLERAGHPEMHHECVARRHRDQEVLRPSLNRQCGRTGQPGGETARERCPQIRPPDDHAFETLPRHDGFEAPPHRFHFREFRHHFSSLDHVLQ
jgi:hypothetical protein